MGAFDNYQSPGATQQGGAFSNYASPATPPSQDLGATALWNKPANVSWPDYFLAHLAKPFQGADQAAQDYSRVAVDAATFGQGDRLQSYLTGNPIEKERAETAAASSRLGAMAPIVSGAMYAMGPGELGIAKGLGEMAAPALGGGKIAQWAGGVLGSGVEGAGAGMIGAAGHDEDPNRGMLVGGGLGAAGGVPGGVVGRGGALAPPQSIADLKAATTTAYAPLKEMVFHGPSQVKPALDAVTNTMTDAEKGLAASTMAKVNKLGDQNLTTGSDIQSYQKLFGGLSKTGSDTDREFAPQFKSALEGVMNAEPYGRNLTPGQGMSLMLPGPLGGTGFAAGDAAAARDAGDRLFGQLKDTQRIQNWMTKAKAGGPDVGSQAKSWLPSEEGMRYAPGPPPGAPPGTQGSPLYEATQNLAATARPESASAPWYLKHTVIAPLAFAGANEAVNAFGGEQSPGARVGEDLAAFPLLMGGMKGYSAVGSALNRAAQQRALAAAQVAASTRQYQAPVQAVTPLRDALRTVIFGRGATGAWPY